MQRICIFMRKLLRNSKKYSNFAADTNTIPHAHNPLQHHHPAPQKQKEPYISNEIKQIFLLNNFVETTLYKENNSTNEKENKNEETSLKNELIKNLSYINYEGEYYENNSLIPNGLLYMQFSTNRNLYPDYFHLIIKLLKFFNSYSIKFPCFLFKLS